MTLRLARLPRSVPIVDLKNGVPEIVLQKWLQSFAEQIEASVVDIEGNIQDISDLLVALGLVEVTADGALALAQSAIDPGGTIKDEKVLTTSMVADAATAGYFAQLSAPVTMPDGVDTEIVSLSFTKAIEESDILIDGALRMESSDDVKGVFTLYRDGGPGVGTAIDTVDWDTRLNGSIAKLTVPYNFVDTGASAGATSYSISFARDGGGSTVTANAGSGLRTLERKR